jgi:hypothetical protein
MGVLKDVLYLACVLIRNMYHCTMVRKDGNGLHSLHVGWPGERASGLGGD